MVSFWAIYFVDGLKLISLKSISTKKSLILNTGSRILKPSILKVHFTKHLISKMAISNLTSKWEFHWKCCKTGRYCWELDCHAYTVPTWKVCICVKFNNSKILRLSSSSRLLFLHIPITQFFKKKMYSRLPFSRLRFEIKGYSQF